MDCATEVTAIRDEGVGCGARLQGNYERQRETEMYQIQVYFFLRRPMWRPSDQESLSHKASVFVRHENVKMVAMSS